MELKDLVQLQRNFDERRSTTFAWSGSITEDDARPLLHNVLSLSGEAGEIANLVKKYDRGDFDFEQLMKELPGELADVAIYLMKIAYQSDIDLEQAILNKMARNEQRFPSRPDDGETEAQGSLTTWQQSILDASARCARNLPPQVTGEVLSLFRAVGVEAPTNAEDVVAAALIAIEFSTAGDLEGRSHDRERAWLALEPIATRVGVDRREVAALTTKEAALRHLLDSALDPRVGAREG